MVDISTSQNNTSDKVTQLPDALQKAVIYTRVSDIKQVREGDGLASQETRCREYAKYKHYDVVEVFCDKGVSGGLIDRPGMLTMIAFLKKHQNQNFIVIIDDISRLARGLEAHLQLRSSLNDAGGKLESPSIEFGEDSDSILVENLLASVAQHHRQKNGEQTKNRMRARVQNGYWVFQTPLGYKFEKTKEHGKLLVRDEPVASIIAEALEGYAAGRFDSPSEVKRFLDNQLAYPKNKKGEVHLSRIGDLLSRTLYAGYITYEPWNIHLQPAKHEPLISLETWQINQNKRLGRANDPSNKKAPIRKDTSSDFPLRGFVKCCDCDRPMTASWSKGSKGGMYGYYFCQTKGCESYRKNIRKDIIEEDFEALLHGIQPAQEAFQVLRSMLEDLWEDRRAKVKAITCKINSEIDKLEDKASQVMSRLLSTTSPTLITAYEGEIQRIEENKLVLVEKAVKSGQPLKPFEEIYRTSLEFLLSPWKLWASNNIIERRTLLRLAFTGRIAYCRNKGYRTQETAMLFNVLKDIKSLASTNSAIPANMNWLNHWLT